LDIPAEKIRSSVPECVLTTTFEWFNTNWVSADGTKGRWEERRTNIDSERFVVDIEDLTVMNAKVNIRQPHYMKDMKAMFGLTTFEGVQDEYEVLVRYVTEDAASQTDKARVVDDIKIIFKSSGETIVDYCSSEYSTLSVTGGTEFTSA
jgi:hypothetical protein